MKSNEIRAFQIVFHLLSIEYHNLLLIFFAVAHSIPGQICLVNGITTSWKTMYKETKIFASLQEAVDQAIETHFRLILPKGVFTMNSSLHISNKKSNLLVFHSSIKF
jgi:hypothetical protein